MLVDECITAITGQSVPIFIQVVWNHLSFGDVAATWSVIEQLGISGIVDDVVGARRSDASASVGTYISLAVLNRVVAYSCEICDTFLLKPATLNAV